MHCVGSKVNHCPANDARLPSERRAAPPNDLLAPPTDRRNGLRTSNGTSKTDHDFDPIPNATVRRTTIFIRSPNSATVSAPNDGNPIQLVSHAL